MVSDARRFGDSNRNSNQLTRTFRGNREFRLLSPKRLSILALALVFAGSVSADDREIERFLLQAKIVEAEEIGVGKTRPWKVRLELDDRRGKAAFKYIDVYNRGYTDFEEGPPELNFSDSYKYDRAAYLMDRHLGLQMVPVTVLRKVRGRKGALVEWISDAIDEESRAEQAVEPDDPTHLARQHELRRLFDALLNNADRNAGNMLYTRPDWSLHLIDHSRCFRRSRELPQAYVDRPARLPRELFGRLQALDEPGLRELLQGLIDVDQIRSLLARRDKIVDKIERERQASGDGAVFF